MSQKPEAQMNPSPAARSGNSPAAQAQPASASPVGGQSLEQVREILFGAQSRELEQRLGQLQQGMVDKIEVLERQTWEALKRLGDQIEALRAEQSKSMDQSRAQASAEAGKHRQSMEESAKKEVEARDVLRAEMMRQLGDLNRKCDQTSARVAEITEQLRVELVDRATLSAVLSEAALRLGAPSLSGAGQDDEGMDALLSNRIVERPSGVSSKGTPSGKR